MQCCSSAAESALLLCQPLLDVLFGQLALLRAAYALVLPLLTSPPQQPEVPLLEEAAADIALLLTLHGLWRVNQ